MKYDETKYDKRLLYRITLSFHQKMFKRRHRSAEPPPPHPLVGCVLRPLCVVSMFKYTVHIMQLLAQAIFFTFKEAHADK